MFDRFIACINDSIFSRLIPTPSTEYPPSTKAITILRAINLNDMLSSDESTPNKLCT